MKISVVTPSFNQGAFIEETILSVRNQRYPDCEHIVVDGGSTDGTIEVLKKYSNVRWISEPDRGQADALNKGFKISTGEIIGWLNSDDTYVENALERVAEFFETRPEVMLTYGYVYVMDAKSRIIRKRYSPDFDFGLLVRTGSCYAQPTFFFRRRILQDVGYMDSSLPRAMDYEYILRVGKSLRVQKMPVFLGHFRTHPGSLSHSGVADETETRTGRLIQERYCSDLPNKYPGVLYGVRDYSILYWYKLVGRIMSLPLLFRYSIAKQFDRRRTG